MDLLCHSIDMIWVFCALSKKYKYRFAVSHIGVKIFHRVFKICELLHKQCKIFLHRHIMGVYHIVKSLILHNKR